MQSTPHAIVGLTPIFIFFACYENLDPLYFTLKALLRFNSKSLKLIFPLRVVIFTLPSLEIMRIVIAIVYMFVGMLYIVMCNVKFISDEFQASISLPQAISTTKYYKIILIALYTFKSPQNTAALVLVGAVALALVCLLTTTFGYYGVIPFYMYVYAPFVSLTILVIMHLMLPKVIVIGDATEEMLRSWRFSRQSDQSLYFRKLLRSLQPAKLYLGLHSYRWILIDKEFKGNYYYEIIDYTITLLITLKL